MGLMILLVKYLLYLNQHIALDSIGTTEMKIYLNISNIDSKLFTIIPYIGVATLQAVPSKAPKPKDMKIYAMMCFREKIAYLLLPSAVRQTRAPKFFI